jgi:hypothetical protein
MPIPVPGNAPEVPADAPAGDRPGTDAATIPADAPPVPFPAFGAAMRAGATLAGFVSQRALSRRCGIMPDELQRYFAGTRLPTLPRFAAIVAAGIDPLPLIAAIPATITQEPSRCPRPN